MTSIGFTIPGRLVSNNKVTRNLPNGRTIKSEEARRDEARVRSMAFAIAMKARWRIPESAALYLTVWNTRKDVGNIEKVISDGLAPPHGSPPGTVGPILRNDKDLRGLHVELDDDDGDERVDVRVEVRPLRPKATRRR